MPFSFLLGLGVSAGLLLGCCWFAAGLSWVSAGMLLGMLDYYLDAAELLLGTVGLPLGCCWTVAGLLLGYRWAGLPLGLTALGLAVLPVCPAVPGYRCAALCLAVFCQTAAVLCCGVLGCAVHRCARRAVLRFAGPGCWCAVLLCVQVVVLC